MFCVTTFHPYYNEYPQNYTILQNITLHYIIYGILQYELYTRVEKITDVIRQTRITFYGLIQRMNPDRLTGKLLTISKSSKCPIRGSKKEKETEELQITQEDIEECLPVKKKLKKCPRFSGEPKKRTCAIWTDESRERDRSRINEMWERRKRE